VPMIVISPWSKGGWVNSEVFDHTSLVRFIEARFGAQYPGLTEGNITPWRRAVAGDLTSAFNFKTPNSKDVSLPSTIAYIPPDFDRHPDYVPVPPTDQAVPAQEPGTRPARAVPYELQVRGEVDLTAGAFNLQLANTGRAAAVFQVRSGNGQGGPWRYTVGAGKSLADTFAVTANGQTAYDLSAYGPNGFLRGFKGSIAGGTNANLQIESAYDAAEVGITLSIKNAGAANAQVRILNVYTNHSTAFSLGAGKTLSRSWELEDSFGWYDFVVTVDSDSGFQQHIAGHVETGRDSVTDPAIGGAGLDE